MEHSLQVRLLNSNTKITANNIAAQWHYHSLLIDEFAKFANLFNEVVSEDDYVTTELYDEVMAGNGAYLASIIDNFYNNHDMWLYEELTIIANNMLIYWALANAALLPILWY